MKASQILAKSPLESFYHVFSSLSLKLIWKMSPLVLGGMVAVSGNTLTADGSILFKIIRISHAQLKSNDLKNETVFPNFLFNFWNLHYILNILKVKMIVIAHVFPNLQTVKNFVRSFCKERRFRTRFDSQHVKSCQIIAKSS